jgi:hypothetical protein
MMALYHELLIIKPLRLTDDQPLPACFCGHLARAIIVSRTCAEAEGV